MDERYSIVIIGHLLLAHFPGQSSNIRERKSGVATMNIKNDV